MIYSSVVEKGKTPLFEIFINLLCYTSPFFSANVRGNRRDVSRNKNIFALK